MLLGRPGLEAHISVCMVLGVCIPLVTSVMRRALLALAFASLDLSLGGSPFRGSPLRTSTMRWAVWESEILTQLGFLVHATSEVVGWRATLLLPTLTGTYYFRRLLPDLSELESFSPTRQPEQLLGVICATCTVCNVLTYGGLSTPSVDRRHPP